MAGPLLLLENPIQRYAWGSPTALPALLGTANPDGGPVAELWMGAHHRAPSQIGARSLRDVIAEDPPALLGPRVAEAFAGELPFLLKVLAAARPLSIQCHPDDAQARAGFAREEAAGIPRDAPDRSYRDPRPKPELIVALTPFFALKGFRAPGDIRAGVEAAGLTALAGPAAHLDEEDGLRRFFSALMTLDARFRRAALEEAAAFARAPRDPRARWVGRLLEAFPGDIGCLAPLLLELVELSPGEGLFLPAGELHAYLEGTGVELMASSDNVLRAGLTEKHIDLDELLRVGRFSPSPPAPLRSRPAGGGLSTWETPAGEFQLFAARAPAARRSRDAVDVVLCTEGAVVLTAGGHTQPIARGQAALVSAAAGAYRIDGAGTVFVATVP